MRQVLRFVGRRHYFSTAPVAAAAGDELSSTTAGAKPPTESLFPSRHSRKRLPPVCTDIVMLKDLTDEVLKAPEGSLFTYRTDKDTAADAWDTADPTCQKVDFLVRGYAARLPGTMWQRWVLSREDDENLIDPNDTEEVTECLTTMEALLDRIWDEGHAYLTVRADRMKEKAERKLLGGKPEVTPELEMDRQETLQLAADDEMAEAMESLEDTKKGAEEEDYGIRFGRSDLDNEPEQPEEDSGGDEEADRPFMNDFALPGPTIDSFHTILDAMACHPNSSFVSLEQTRLLWSDILARHEVDGGDLKNTQPQTAISVMSYNVPIRIVASLPYKNNDVNLRDYGLLLAFEAFDALTHSERCERNSATFAYILQTVAKYMPPSRNKGNVAAGLFYMAQEEGCVDKTVLDAYQLANTPSNGPEFDSWSSSSRGKNIAELPHSWRRNKNTRRHNIRDATY